jgi:hypothetical protein
MKQIYKLVVLLLILLFSCGRDDTVLSDELGKADSTEVKPVDSSALLEAMMLVNVAKDYLNLSEENLTDLFIFEHGEGIKGVSKDFRAYRRLPHHQYLSGLNFSYIFRKTDTTNFTNIDTLDKYTPIDTITHSGNLTSFDLDPVFDSDSAKLGVYINYDGFDFFYKYLSFKFLGKTIGAAYLISKDDQIYKINNDAATILITKPVTLALFKNNVDASKAATYVVKEGETIYQDADTIKNDSRLILTDSIGRDITYDVTVQNPTVNVQLTTTDFIINEDSKTINIPEGTKVSDFKAKAFPPSGGSLQVFNPSSFQMDDDAVIPDNSYVKVFDTYGDNSMYTINVVPLYLSITTYEKDHIAGTITIPENTTFNDFDALVNPAPEGGTYVVKDASDNVISGDNVIPNNAKAVSTNGGFEKVYTITTTSTPVQIEIQTINQVKGDEIILNAGVTISQFPTRVSSTETIKYYNASDVEITQSTHQIVTGDYIKLDDTKKYTFKVFDNIRITVPLGPTFNGDGSGYDYLTFAVSKTLGESKGYILSPGATYKFFNNSDNSEVTGNSTAITKDMHIKVFSSDNQYWIRYDINTVF